MLSGLPASECYNIVGHKQSIIPLSARESCVNTQRDGMATWVLYGSTWKWLQML